MTNADVKIPYKVLANQIKKYIYQYGHSPQFSCFFFPEMQGWFYICKLINIINYINGLRNYMVILTDVERLFDKIQHPIMLKLLKELRIEGICFQHNKGYIQ